MKICAITCYRNEGWRIPDWCAHHSFLGVDKFFITDDQSSDGSPDLVVKLPYNIELLASDKIGRYHQSSNPNEYGTNADLHTRLQRNYRNMLMLAKEEGYDWALVIDIDEYVTPISAEDCKKDFLKGYFSPLEHRIYIHSFDMQGSFGPESSVTLSTKTWSKNEKAFGIVNGVSGWFKERGKSAINIRTWNSVCSCAHNISHQPFINDGDQTNLSPETRNNCVGYREKLRINHYRNFPLLNSFSDTFGNAKIIYDLICENR